MKSSYNNTKARSASIRNPDSTRNSLSRFPKLLPTQGEIRMAFKVLIVDDEPDLEVLIRQRFRKRIKDGEFEFVFAHDGEDALNKLREDPTLDVVMSDINMPVMDGLTLLSRLTDIKRILKAVIVSAYG